MLLHIFVGSLLPYIEALDSWLFEGTLDDPFEEVIVIKNLFYSQKLRIVCLCCAQELLQRNYTFLKIDIINVDILSKIISLVQEY